MKRRYEFSKKLGPAKLDRIHEANAIIAEYAAQGLNLTLRQLYYQFVARDLIPNTDRSYKNLGAAITDGRMAGLIDWTSIEDRTRFIRGNSHWGEPADIVDAAAQSFRLDLWASQKRRVEVWIEKDALIGVIEGICTQLDVDYFSCRGYVSASEMWAAAQRLDRYMAEDQDVTILHLGDHDPSGMQMTEDIAGRLATFNQVDKLHDMSDAGIDLDDRDAVRDTLDRLADVNVHRIALTMDQVDEYDPPPNPAKLTDSRAGAYVRDYGYDSWELDALDPTTLRDLITGHVTDLRDDDVWDVDVARQEAARAQLVELAEQTRDEWA